MRRLQQQAATLSRRSFIAASAAVAGSLTIGFRPAAAQEATSDTTNPFQAYLRIGPDHTVTVLSAHMEGGQGIYSGLATLIAEELDADWEQMSVEGASGNPDFYGNKAMGGAFQLTGGSTAMVSSWQRYREAGAVARQMLVEAAAQQWGVAAEEIRIDRGVVSHPSGREGRFGDFVAAAAGLPVPAEIALKPREEWKYIGNDEVRRRDTVDKTRGQQDYTIDVQLPGMLTAVLKRPPRFGGKVAGFDAEPIKAMPGVIDVVETPRGVAVVAKSYWEALKGRDALNVEWDESDAEKRGTAELMAMYKDAAVNGEGVAVHGVGDATRAMDDAATAVVMQLLTEQGRFGSTVGRGSFAVLLAQDIAVVPILFVVGALGAGDEGGVFIALAGALGKALLAVVLILGIGRLALRPLFRFVSGARSPELFMAATLLIVIATAALTESAGLSAALGAFLAGLLFAETEFRHEIEVDIEPFKGLLLGLFFMSVGMIIDPAEVLAEPLWIPLAVLGLFALKAVITALLARLFGFGLPHATEMGLVLAQGGEFAFVVVALAMNHALLPPETAQFMLIVVALTMFLTPLVFRLARMVGAALEVRAGGATDDELADDIAPDLADHVVLAGFGRTGQLLAALLDRQQIVHVAIDLDAAHVAAQRRAGASVWLGNATRGPMLERLHIARAAALVVTTDDSHMAERVVTAARALAPELPIVVRARDSAHAARLLAGGATQVVPEVFEAGLEMGRMTLEHAGLPAEAARELIDGARVEGEHAFARRGQT